MFMKGVFMLFLSLGLGYVLCVLAKKQEGLLKTLGYTLGISILVLSLIYALETSYSKFPLICQSGGPISKMYGSMSKFCPFAK